MYMVWKKFWFGKLSSPHVCSYYDSIHSQPSDVLNFSVSFSYAFNVFQHKMENAISIGASVCLSISKYGKRDRLPLNHAQMFPFWPLSQLLILLFSAVIYLPKQNGTFTTFSVFPLPPSNGLSQICECQEPPWLAAAANCEIAAKEETLTHVSSREQQQSHEFRDGGERWFQI